MSTTFDGELDLEYGYRFGFEDEELVADYDSPYEEEDFEALGINPGAPTVAKPGSEDKVSMLAARYAAGLPLWHTEDCYDHGPAK